MGIIHLNAVYVSKNCRWCEVKVAAREEDLPACWDCQDLYEKLEGNKDLVIRMMREINNKIKEDN